MSTFHDQFMGLSAPERERIVLAAGLSLGYVKKHIYASKHAPVFHFHNAAAMDKASAGVLPFMQHTAHTGDIDWGYVRRSLNRLHKLESV